MPVDLQLLGAFIVTATIAMVTPGPDMLFVLGCGMRGGPRAGLLATTGVAISEAIHVAMTAGGLMALFAAVPTAFAILRIAGAAYLVYLGVRLVRHRKDGDEDAPPTGTTISGRRAFWSGVMTNLSNPKMIAFSVAFLPQFVDPNLGRVWMQFSVLGAIMITLEFLVDGAVGVFAGRIGTWLRHRQALRRRIDTATGGIFIGLGIRLAAGR